VSGLARGGAEAAHAEEPPAAERSLLGCG
jgi:hypothetical protein